MRVVDSELIVTTIKTTMDAVYPTDIVDTNSNAVMVQPKDVPTIFTPTEFNVAFIIDYGNQYTGGGFYLWEMALAFAQRKDTHVYVYTDTFDFVYSVGEVVPS